VPMERNHDSWWHHAADKADRLSDFLRRSKEFEKYSARIEHVLTHGSTWLSFPLWFGRHFQDSLSAIAFSGHGLFPCVWFSADRNNVLLQRL
jgi:hypothetical protein